MSPIAIAEVLSESTEGYDWGDKFEAYRTIPTFQEYSLIDQARPHVEHYVKQLENQWLFTEYQSLDQSFTLQSITVELTLADLYEAVFSQ
jgi:Uma2 family endonuclease